LEEFDEPLTVSRRISGLLNEASGGENKNEDYVMPLSFTAAHIVREVAVLADKRGDYFARVQRQR
jgi:hypothetical protein